MKIGRRRKRERRDRQRKRVIKRYRVRKTMIKREREEGRIREREINVIWEEVQRKWTSKSHIRYFPKKREGGKTTMMQDILTGCVSPGPALKGAG